MSVASQSVFRERFASCLWWLQRNKVRIKVNRKSRAFFSRTSACFSVYQLDPLSLLLFSYLFSFYLFANFYKNIFSKSKKVVSNKPSRLKLTLLSTTSLFREALFQVLSVNSINSEKLRWRTDFLCLQNL